jgi:hypothetical protein
MSELIQEFVDSRGVPIRVDREGGVIRGVKIIGLVSRNGRRYLPQALSEAAALYEGAKVNVNHPKGHPLAPRDYQDRIGVIRGVESRDGEGLFGDLHYNPRHALAEQLVWDAEHAPENVGFSHNVLARTARRGDDMVVEAITQVQSVDLVADPAATRGLFEEAGLARPTAGQASSGTQAGSGTPITKITLDELKAARPDLLDQIREELARDRGGLGDELLELRARLAVAERRDAIRRLLADHSLPYPTGKDPVGDTLVSEAFVATLLAAPDEAAVKSLIEERARLVRCARNLWPASLGGRIAAREQTLGDSFAAPGDARAFVKAIT